MRQWCALETKVDFAAPLSDVLLSLQNTNYSVFLLQIIQKCNINAHTVVQYLITTIQ